MVEQTNKKVKKKGLFYTLSALLAALLISLLLSILFEWLGIAFFWSEQGYLHSQAMMIQELGWISESTTRSLFGYSPSELANTITLTLHDWLFVKTGFQPWLQSPNKHSDWEYLIYHYTRAYLESVIYVSITFVVRLIVIIFTSPLFLLAAFAGFTEGLMRRDLRKFGSGRESSFLYHHARRYIKPVMIGSWVLYLSIPVSVYPNIILIPAAFLFGLSICITVASFKKYL
ncbi:integrating conjugative element membrane protein [Actinobacillus seminis]|uniref:Integrating conjugative element membrane protein n=1 Tax=Actinobacillus seminis TaxID=722 RepID=A0A263HEX7_9PAST|nr:TIGR03747 family integrating conjugative element membrane protein [Actinobacillus seminis]OZN25681.1 integrating conjugative element membrane protein [Actinobacillus seminis]SUU37078.1 integrating conjugative element membrane protein, PFL_4697 family [Actinobacillus seminis]